MRVQLIACPPEAILPIQLGLPRLAARISNERIRQGVALPAAVAADLLAPHHPRDNGIATMTAGRLDSSADRDQPASRAGALAAANRRYAQTAGGAARHQNTSYRNACRHRTGIPIRRK